MSQYAGDDASQKFEAMWPAAKEKGWTLQALHTDKDEKKDEWGRSWFVLLPPPEYHIQHLKWASGNSYVVLNQNFLVKNWIHYGAYDKDEQIAREARIRAKHAAEPKQRFVTIFKPPPS
jgi:hypothetical protein